MTFRDPHRTEHMNRLLNHARRYPDREIRTGEVRRFYEAWGIGPKRSTAKADLHALEARGHIVGHGPVERRRYRLAGGAR